MQRIAKLVRLQLAILLTLTLGMLTVGSVSAMPLNQSTAVDIVLVIDGSGSITPSDFLLAKQFALKIANSCILGTDAQVGIVQFSTTGQTRREQELSSDFRQVANSINNMVAIGGMTDITEGIETGQDMLANGRANAEKMMILITDGDHNGSGNPVTSATNIKNAGTIIFAIGIGLPSTAQINAIASDPDSEHVFTVNTFSQLEQVLQRVLRASCDVDYYPLKPVFKPAFITVVDRASASANVAPDDTITRTIVATNRGKGPAKDATITVPLKSDQVQVIDVTTSRPSMWVSAINSDSIQIRTGRLSSNGDVVTATLRLRALVPFQAQEQVGDALSYSWRDNASGGAGSGNLPVLAISNGSQPFFYTMQGVSTISSLSIPATFSSNIFKPGEPIAFWYNTPDGKVIELGRGSAQSDGTAIIELIPQGADVGEYSLVAHGIWTEFTAVAAFSVSP